MDIDNMFKIFSEKNCSKVYVKLLSANDNSKNQVYFGGDFSVLNIFPISEIIADRDGERKTETFKSKLNFSWIDEQGLVYNAPYSQLILYPEYPEVRFSGFLKGCKEAPSSLMKSRDYGRLLFIGIDNNNKLLAYVTGRDSEIAKGYILLKNLNQVGVFNEILLVNSSPISDTKVKLLSELKRIHNLGWIDSKRLTPDNRIIPCTVSQCGGYTLEAELDIQSNGLAKPDYLGWEIKQFNVPNFDTIGSKAITLMDHSPDNGYFYNKGAEEFLKNYGYKDKKGKENRTNFGGVHKYGIVHKLTNLKLISVGFDLTKLTITDSDGCIALVDNKDNIAASWSFKGLIKHWNTKHIQACYVPSIKRVGEEYIFSNLQYSYGNNIILGINTNVLLLLKQICLMNVYYDPAVKLESPINGSKKILKTRSLFRVKAKDLLTLYEKNELVNLKNI